MLRDQRWWLRVHRDLLPLHMLLEAFIEEADVTGMDQVVGDLPTSRLQFVGG